MSSSDEDAVRRPGRGAAPNGRQTPPESDAENNPLDQMDEDDDADLFGSDGEDGGLDNLEYGSATSLGWTRTILTSLLAMIAA